MSSKLPRRGVQNANLLGAPGSALSSLVPVKSESGASASPVRGFLGVSDASHVGEPYEQPKRPKPRARRDPTKVDAELLQQMRNLTAFIRGRGRPMAELGELIDEALSEYLGRQCRELNEGESFPDVGRLR